MCGDWQDEYPGEEHSRDRASGVRRECLRNSQEDNVGGEKLFRGIIVKEEIREVTRS